MALNQALAEADFLTANDSADPGYTPNLTEPQAIANWADILDSMASAVIPASTTAVAAKAAFEAAAVGMSTPVTGLATLVSAVNTYATELGGGMTGYTAVPPVFDSNDLSDATLNAPGVTVAQAATLITGKMLAKFQQGTATLNVPPFTVLNWS